MTKEGPQDRIVAVDDEPPVRELYRRLFREAGIVADVVAGGREAVELMKDFEYGLALVDLKMPDFDGMTTIKAISQGRPGTPILVVTGVFDPELHERVRAHDSVVDIVSKPFVNADLLSRIRQILRSRRPLET